MVKTTTQTSQQQLPPDWQSWLAENLARGCNPQQLLDTLAAHGFAWQSLLHDAGLSTVSLPAQSNTPSSLAAHLFDSDQHQFDCDGHLLRLTAQLKQPQVLCFENFLTDQECAALIELAERSPAFARSTVVSEQDGSFTHDNRRSSHHAWFARGADPVIARIEQRVATVLAWPVDHAEGLQVLRYGVGAEYRPHFDFFDPKQAGSRQHIATGGQRVGTLIMYLSEVAAGGATDFPEAGFTLRPKKGAAVFFANLYADGQPNYATLHAGLPVVSGVKYIATKWLRERVYA